MDLSVILTWQSLILCLALYAIVYVFRNIFESLPKLNLKDRLFWREGVLPTAPILFGILLALIPATSYFCPGDTGATLINRILYFMVAGLCSGYVYAKVKSFINSIKITANGVTATDEKAVQTEETLTDATESAEDKS